MYTFKLPTEVDIINIAKSFAGTDNYEVSRFPTGMCHYVFKVVGNRSKFVIRVSHPEKIDFLRGNVFWTEELSKYELPIPKLLELKISDNSSSYSYQIISYIDGEDISSIYPKLNNEQKKNILKELITFQGKAALLPHARGFGFLTSYNDQTAKASWGQVIERALVRAKSCIIKNNIFPQDSISSAENLFHKFEGYFNEIKPIAFFHDLTTKNLLISRDMNHVAGIVDIDEMCFGDNLFLPSLTRMALISSRWDLDYIDMWCKEISINDQEKRVLDYYTLIHCLAFMGEIGQVFNKRKPVIINDKHCQYLQYIFDQLSSALTY